MLDGLKSASYEKFLALVPPKIRETVILDFLTDAEHIREAWRALSEAERGEVLESQAHLVHAMIHLLDTPFAKSKFPALKFEFERSYSSAMLGKMGREQQQATFHMIASSMEAAKIPKGLLAKQLSAEELERFLVLYVERNAATFYNALNPGLRRQLWLAIGRTYRDRISKGLHALDKIEILQSTQETAMELTLSNGTFLKHLMRGEDPDFAATLYLNLKKLNKKSSRTAMLRQVLDTDDWHSNRLKGVPAFLTQPRNAAIYEKLAEHVDELVFRFDSLICTKADYEQLKEHEPLADAVVTLVDDLVDPSLYNLFQEGRLAREDYDAFSHKVEDELAELRRKLAAREAEDPVGVYVVETMQILHQLTNETLSGELSAETLHRLDERTQIRTRLVDSMREHVRRIEDFLAKGKQQLPALKKKTAQITMAARAQAAATQAAQTQAGGLVQDYRKAQQLQARANDERKQVALAQKQLSVQFFELIQPLILEKVRSLGNPLKTFMRMVGLGGEESAGGAEQRVIFKFSDEEIAQILRYKIVFCAKDTMLAQFVATCLRIDKLEGSLFTLATAESLPHNAEIDILFYGPGYSVEDFGNAVKEHRMVAFADDAFYQRLVANEQRKARTKAMLGKAGQQVAALRPKLQAANQTLKQHQARRAQLQQTLATLEREQHKLRENLRAQLNQHHALQGELELVESRLTEVDGTFDDLRGRLTQLLEDGAGETGAALQAGNAELTQQLRDELVGLNGELARMMFIKGVKDAGETITRTTQEGIAERMEAQERYHYKQRPLNKLIVVDDGSNTAQTLKQTFLHVALRYFKLRDMGVQEFSLNRLLALAEGGNGKDYPFVAVFVAKPEDDYHDLKLSVKKLRALMPDTYQLLFTPFGELAEVPRERPYFKNIAALKEHCALVNTSFGHVDDAPGMLKVLREKAPLN